MPAGDAEGDSKDRQWEQRVELMRDAIIYNRNNPSILFYECGNRGISDEHMLDMKKVRDQYNPQGGRAIGAREMLSSNVAEYGGEMLYVDKSFYECGNRGISDEHMLDMKKVRICSSLMP